MMKNTIHNKNLKMFSNIFAGRPNTLLAASAHAFKRIVYICVCFAHLKANLPSLGMKTSMLEAIRSRQVFLF
jgi:hypothetical protein